MITYTKLSAMIHSISKLFRLLTIFLWCLLIGVAAPTNAQPAGFSDQLFMGGWDQVVGMTFDDNCKIYVWEKKGKVWIIEDGVKLPDPLIDISEEVGGWRDFGLVGFALDPDFVSNGHFYLCYTVDRHHLLYFGTNQYNSNTDEYFNATIGRVTRYTAQASTNFTTVDYNSRNVLVGETKETGIPSLHESHGIGQLVFGEDNTLMVCTGDGASYNSVDEGSASETYYAQALADGIITSGENIGAYRSQSLNSLDGKILRIDPETGDGVPTNPFYNGSQPRSPQSRVWARGVRNPYRMVKKPDTGSHFESDGDPGVFYFGDVGWGNREELGVVTSGGLNFGWPKFEGMTNQPGYNNPTYNPANHERPRVDWRNGTPRALVNGTIYNVGSAQMPGPSFSGNASTGGVWYTGTDFPEAYQNTYFHADYGAGWIRNFSFDANHNPTEVNNFISNAGAVVFVTTSPVEGGLYYVSYPNNIRKITYNSSGNKDPIAIASADQNDGPGPLTVQFVGNESYDPDGNPLSFSWNFGDGTSSSQINPKHTFTPNNSNPISYNVTLTLSDNNGGVDQQSLIVSANNNAPVINSTSIDNVNTFNPNNTTNLNLSANVSDAEHSAAQLSYQWQTLLMHNNHMHEEAIINNPTGSTLLTPIGCGGATYWYRIKLTVTDAAGLSTVFVKNIYPNCSGTNQTISFYNIPDKLVGSAPFNLNVSASSGLLVTSYVVEGPAMSVANQITLNGQPGLVTVRAIQSGNATYKPATPVERSFFVHPANIQNQTINFPNISNKLTTSGPFNLNASATSGLGISYDIVSGPATVSGNTVSLTGATGVVVVRACQSGNMQYDPANPVQRSFNVTSPGCTDNDNDGVCLADDCDDGNPNIPTTAGTTCNDGNSNTTNDVIQSDGCTCAGTPQVGSCTDIVITSGPTSITVSGLNAPITQVQIFSPSWQTLLNCSGDCGATETLSNLTPGSHYVKVRFYTADWSLICEIDDYINLTGGPCTDNDNDGVCASNDCNDNNPNIPTTPGTSCNDGNSNTTNDVILADGCTCQGTPIGCTDNDNDGICAPDDCDDGNPNIPTTAGTTCNDGNSNTTNDVIQSDGCTCAGTPQVGDCSSIVITPGSTSITVSGLNAPITQVQIFSPTWQTILNCSGDCGTTETVNSLTPGSYYIKVRFYTAGWSLICEIDDYITITGGPCTDNDNDGVCAPDDCNDNNPNIPTTPGTSCNDGNSNTNNDVILANGCTCQGTPSGCTDNDNDGVCAPDDCEDNDPGIPTTPGTACNDGNSNTANDVIQSDGCTCAGTPPAGGDCADVVISAGPTSITVTGLNSPITQVQIFNPTWQQVLNCSGDCGTMETASGLAPGSHFVKIRLYTAGWSLICEIEDYITITGGPCTDNDNDDVCAPVDCDDNNPNLPTTPGTTCNDGNSNTTNDVIQSDGCTCAGTPIGGGTDVGCGLSYISTSNSTTISGLSAGHVIVKLFSPSWSTVYSCVDDCPNPLTVNGLSNGTYHLSVNLYNANWQETCSLTEDLIVGTGQPLEATQEQEVLFFTAMKNGREVNLNWVTNTEYKNEYFVIEHSLDGDTFEPIQTVESIDEVMAERLYQEVDVQPYQGINFYRLQQVALDGSFRYSDTKAVRFDIDLKTFGLFPNPAADEIFLNLSDYKDLNAAILIINALGQTIMQTNIVSIPENAIRFDLSEYRNGVYSISIKVEERQRMTKQFVISRLY